MALTRSFSRATQNRALNLALEKEKQKVAALQAEKAKGPSTPSGVASPHASPALDSSTIEGLARSMVSQAAEAAEAASKEAQAWKEKAQAQTNRVSQAEQRAFSLEIEIKKLQRALTREVGEEIPLSKVLEEGSDWKGRRETIIALRDQVKQLRESQGLTTKNKQEVASEKAISSISSKKAQEMEKLTQELSSTRTELELTKAKLDGAVSRRKVLENDLTALKEKVGIVLEKTTTDDKLIAALKAEVETLRRSGGTSGSGSGSGGLDDELFWREMSALKSKCQEQEGQLSRQEAIIKSLTAQAAKSAAD